MKSVFFNIKISFLKNVCIACLSVSFFSQPCILKAQIYNFKNFSTASNIPDTYVYAVNEQDNGFLWVSTGSGIARFDGFNFYEIVFPDSVFSRYSTVIFKDSTGRLWFGCNDGSLFYTENDELVKYKDLGLQSINQIFESDDGCIVVIPQEKSIIKINIKNPELITKYYVPPYITITSGLFLENGTVILGTPESLLQCKIVNDSLSVVSTIEGIEYTKVQSLLRLKQSDIFIAGTEGSGLYVISLNNDKPIVKRPDNKLIPNNLDIRSVFEARDGTLWISTFGSGLLNAKINRETFEIESVLIFDTSKGLQSNDVKCVFEDFEGNIWAGLYGEGLSMLSSQAFCFYIPGETPEKNNIIYVAENDADYFLGTPSGFYTFNPEKEVSGKYFELRTQINTDISAYYFESLSSLWAGTKGKGLFRISRNGQAKEFYYSENSGRNYIRHINSDGENLWLSTLEGIVVINKKDGKQIATFNINNRLPHNSINQVFILNTGEALAATECDRLYKVTLKEGVTPDRRIMTGYIRNKVLCYTQSKNGDIWAGTAGNGIFWFTGDSLIQITTANKLLSNFCYSLLADSNGMVWIGHERGFSRFDTKTGTVKTFPADFIGNVNCNPNAIIEDKKGIVAIGTNEGLMIYDRSKERTERVIPKTNIVSITINNIIYPLRREYVLPYGKYSIKIHYVGINLGNPQDVYYITKMDNWDDQWSGMKTDREVLYTLSDGHYRFNLISFNNEGLSDNKPVIIDFYIKVPFWRTSWFMLLAVTFISSVIIIIIKQRERAQVKIKKYLEDELAVRTSEVVKQKEVIELKNNEITDSINYARRIQASILPDPNKLKEAFSDAFIIFQPRDIVSGDFYWFERIDDKRFIVVCADSTGHGIPGAFMSMIGATLLQDIISGKKITKPSQILTLLDKQIFTTVNQNVDIGVSNDGMDMVVCEINIPERHIRFASAMRPVIIMMGGESYYIKGNRCSVGGESVTEKYFDDQEYYLGKGDSIYMFSDGFPDQFGGTEGKKMKISRLKSLIESVHQLPMEEQKEIITKFYYDWKGSYEQVDDVLMIGIRF